MRKMVEIEYVGIEDVQEIMDDAYAVMQSTDHYVNVEMSNFSKVEPPLVQCKIIIGGYDYDKGYDKDYYFYMSDNESDVAKMNSCKSALKNLLAEE